jgi:hypothetical protein
LRAPLISGSTDRSNQLNGGRAPGVDERFACIVRIAAANLTALLYSSIILLFFGLPSLTHKAVIFSLILGALPFCSAVAVRAGRQISPGARHFLDVTNSAVVTVSAGVLASVSVGDWLFKISIPMSNVVLRSCLIIVICMHLGVLAVGLCSGPSTRSRLISGIERCLTLGGRFSTPLAFSLFISAAMLMTFYVGLGNPLSNVIVGLIGGLDPKPSWVILALASVCAVGALGVCFYLIVSEREHQAAKRSWISFVRRIAPALAVFSISYFYFDYKFETDVLHFLANVGPASQIALADSVPMVTAFSQYGPGPMVVTWLAFLVTQPSFHTANILAQLHSIAFYSAILLCLYRMTPFRVSALWLGFFAVGVLLAGWWGGNGSLNSVPSSMGMRYLPNAFLVLAISYLPRNRTLSVPLFLAIALSALWSFETLAGSIFIFGMFILILSVRERNIRGFFRGIVLGALAPVTAAVVLNCAVTLLWAGKLPDYLAYLQFALIYNMTSQFWSLDTSGAFWGWIPVAVVVMAVLTLAWLSALNAVDGDPPFDSYVLIYRFAPMAVLTGFMSSYFAGRSVDFTLIISFLPFSALVIPAILMAFHDSMSGRKSSVQLGAIAALIVFVALLFSFSALYRKGAPYSTAISECLYDRNCTPLSLAKVTAQRFALRPMLDQAANPNYFDTSGLAQEAVSLIQRYAPDRRKVPLFLGIHPTTIWSVHTNTVLVLTGKGHRWPISYVLSDEINPALEEKVLNADVRLEEGEIVFIRSDESRLGKLEAAIVAKIRSSSLLCPLAPAGHLVTAYRATFLQHCDQGT